MTRRSPAPPPVRPVEAVQAVVDGGLAVVEPDPDRAGAATLWIDGVPQSYVDLADPSYLGFEYVRQIGDVIDIAFPTRQPITALHLGGGALTLPRYVAATRRGSVQRVAEVDGALVELVRSSLPLRRGDKITISTASARDLLRRQRDARFDLVVVDVFAQGRVPADVLSVECFAELARVLRPTGVAVLNLADGGPLQVARRTLAGARSVLPSVALAAEPSVWRGRRLGNLVLVASHATLPVDALRRRLAGGVWPARLVDGAELRAFQGTALPITDADLPGSVGITTRPSDDVFQALRPPPREDAR